MKWNETPCTLHVYILLVLFASLKIAVPTYQFQTIIYFIRPWQHSLITFSQHLGNCSPNDPKHNLKSFTLTLTC